MAALLSSLQRLANSPTWQRDASAITSPLRMGGWFLMLNCLFMTGMVSVYLLVTASAGNVNSAASIAIASLGMGQMMATAIFLSLILFLTFFVPIRVFGTFLGPRTARYFDQIVISGVSPWRYLVGKLWAQNVFLLVVLFVSMPYFLLCLSFGGVSLGYVVICFASLVLYANVLVVVMLTASMFVSEIVAIVIVIGGFLALAGLGLLPWGPHPLNITPTSIVLEPFYQSHVNTNPYFRLFGRAIREPFPGLTLFQSHWLLFAFEAVILLAMGGLAIALGPLNCLTKGLNTFGEAIFQGDKKRTGWFRKRFNLRRQAELSFFYENTSRAWRQKDFSRRWMLREMLFVGLMATALIWLYWLVAERMQNRFYGLHTVFAWCSILLNVIFFSDTWVTDRLRCHKWEAGTLNTWFFVANSLLIVIAFGWWPYALEFSPAPYGWGRPVDTLFGLVEVFEQNLARITFMVVVSFSAYTILRYQTLRFASKFASLLVTLMFTLVLWLLPTWLGQLANVTVPVDSNEPMRAAWLSMCSPWNSLRVLDGKELDHWVSLSQARLGVVLCLMLHLAVAVVMFVLYRRRRNRQLEVRDL